MFLVTQSIRAAPTGESFFSPLAHPLLPVVAVASRLCLSSHTSLPHGYKQDVVLVTCE